MLLPLASWIVAEALEGLCGDWGKFSVRWEGMVEGSVSSRSGLTQVAVNACPSPGVCSWIFSLQDSFQASHWGPW